MTNQNASKVQSTRLVNTNLNYDFPHRSRLKGIKVKYALGKEPNKELSSFYHVLNLFYNL